MSNKDQAVVLGDVITKVAQALDNIPGIAAVIEEVHIVNGRYTFKVGASVVRGPYELLAPDA